MGCGKQRTGWAGEGGVAAATAAGIAENKKLAKGPGSRAPATCSFQCRGGMRRVCLKGERYRSTFFSLLRSLREPCSSLGSGLRMRGLRFFDCVTLDSAYRVVWYRPSALAGSLPSSEGERCPWAGFYIVLPWRSRAPEHTTKRAESWATYI